MTQFMKQLEQMLEKGSVRLAIEGGSASGKTTLAAELQKRFDCTVFHMDDFFLRPHQRTPERLAEPGGNVDRERFLDEVLLPLSKGEAVEYHPYDCATKSLRAPIKAEPKRLTVIEGAYSMHPELEQYYDLSVFLELEPALQLKRIVGRNTPAQAARFWAEWIPLENLYFEKTCAKERCDLVIEVKE